mmetsp:Transcript_6148/g.12506  ORF Transcript_6148/g.12506 Transcript_6148/m.12506 type:complete len:81 (+) Transcript_6148:152-394(+)|eukprot:CAMPEP_0171512094 /NCGR_PEP_ID=MMETSP0959-20130129/1382_1 /TAXON_ID=87120 /ORGANISM="Aurantiochytrium limacinum, Strain ATCCMYA-1381" /LENGTH=80 /DNA_ID=CAMNT_0012049839 /DNA_START=607 /DNA_END=849 /DNA_ORIENTATION=+
MSSPSEELTKAGVDLAVHASILLKGLMTAGAYALYKKYFADDLNSEAARNFRQELPQLVRDSSDGQVHAPSVESIAEDLV